MLHGAMMGGRAYVIKKQKKHSFYVREYRHPLDPSVNPRMGVGERQ